MVPRRLSMLFSALVLLAAPASGQEAERFDLIVRGGRVVDGTGNPWIRADVGVRGDRIARVGDLAGAAADRVVDAAGLVVAPGFIDPHTHAVRGIYDVPTADNYLLQGVTTLTEGNDGGSPWPIGAHLEEIAATGISPNWAVFAGQGTIRGEVLGSEDREPTRDELDRMRTLVAEAMEAGALGLSTGLFYVPGSFTPTEEVIALSEVAAAYGGIYISHMRDEAQGLLDSVRETIRIGEEAGLPVQMTHHKAIGRDMWGRSVDSLALVDAARARGVDITIDQYPYTASQTGITAVVPQWAQEGGTSELVVRLEDPETRRRIREEIVYRIEHDRGGGDPANIVIGLCEWDRSLEGKSLADILADRGEAVTVVAAADLVMEIIENGGARAIYHAMDEADVERIMQHPATAIGSDGGVSVFGESVPHPREYGTFARVLGRYVRERGVLTLEEAVRKMSGATAQRIGLLDRGLVREGFFADLAVFDPARIVDRATFEEPHQYAEGVVYVLVNGTLVVDGGEHTGARPGRVLYGPGRPWGSAAPALAQEASGAPPVVWVLATGGTISGGGASSTSLTEYRAGAFSGEQLVAAVPDLARHATIRVEQVANIGSPNITFGDWLTLARRIDDIFRGDPEAAGVVITHGTNTLEETAYFLNLTVRHDRPVVLVGAQRPATAISADGPLNLLNAVRTAAAPEARGKGVLVVMNDEINAARDVTKTSTYRVETFRSRDLGFLGYVDGDRVSFYRAPTKRHTADSEFDLAGVTAFPTVDIVYSYVEPNPVLIETLIAEGVDGIVLAGTGAGLVSRVERAALEEVAALPAAERPVIVRSNRTGSGRVVPLPAYDEQGMIAGDTLNPQKARILLMLALTKTRDLDEIRRIFREY